MFGWPPLEAKAPPAPFGSHCPSQQPQEARKPPLGTQGRGAPGPRPRAFEPGPVRWQSPAPGQHSPSPVFGAGQGAQLCREKLIKTRDLIKNATVGLLGPTYIRIVTFSILTACFTSVVKTLKWFLGIRCCILS